MLIIMIILIIVLLVVPEAAPVALLAILGSAHVVGQSKSKCP